MEHDERYLAWIHRRRKVTVPAGFADRVVSAVVERSLQRGTLRAWVLALLLSRPGRIALCAIAGLACAFRALQVFAVFVP